MYCRECGTRNPEGSNFCGKCGAPLSERGGAPRPGKGEPAESPSQAPKTVRPAPPPAVPPGHTRIQPPPPAVRPYYAGFWKRFAAYLIDETILSFVGIMLLLVVAGTVGIPMGLTGYHDDVIGPFIAIYFVLIDTVLNWLYYTILESSARQATPGKMALGIVVTDMEGRRVSFGRANARFWSKILSGLFFSIGYVIAGFTERKQALHDLIAATLVINR